MNVGFLLKYLEPIGEDAGLSAGGIVTCRIRSDNSNAEACKTINFSVRTRAEEDVKRKFPLTIWSIWWNLLGVGRYGKMRVIRERERGQGGVREIWNSHGVCVRCT